MNYIPTKNSTQPPRGGWAPGEYLNTCPQCKEAFVGDKRASQCADCAYETKQKEKHMLTAREYRSAKRHVEMAVEYLRLARHAVREAEGTQLSVLNASLNLGLLHNELTDLGYLAEFNEIKV